MPIWVLCAIRADPKTSNAGYFALHRQNHGLAYILHTYTWATRLRWAHGHGGMGQHRRVTAECAAIMPTLIANEAHTGLSLHDMVIQLYLPLFFSFLLSFGFFFRFEMNEKRKEHSLEKTPTSSGPMHRIALNCQCN